MKFKYGDRVALNQNSFYEGQSGTVISCYKKTKGIWPFRKKYYVYYLRFDNLEVQKESPNGYVSYQFNKIY